MSCLKGKVIAVFYVGQLKFQKNMKPSMMHGVLNIKGAMLSQHHALKVRTDFSEGCC
jgi:hypothetical protein